jgi:NADH-quinone oxidoreductase subunit J
MADIVFYLFAALTIVSAAAVVFSRNIVYSAVSLLFTFFGVAGLYVFLAADFLAVVQLVIYVGGILVLLLFGVMLTNRITSVQLRTGTLQFLPALIVIAIVLGVLLRVIWGTNWGVHAVSEMLPTSSILGSRFMTDFLVPFEVVSILILAALVGAAYLARRERS